MIIANLVQTWEPYHLVQARLNVLMKNVQIVITNPVASPVMTGMPPPKPAPRNAAVVINIPALEQVIPAAAVRLVMDYMGHVLALADIFGVENLALKKMLA